MNKDESTLSNTDLVEMKDLDRRLADALSRKDLDAAAECFWNDPDLVLMLNGTVFRGPEAARAAIKAMFAQNETIKVEVNELLLPTTAKGITLHSLG